MRSIICRGCGEMIPYQGDDCHLCGADKSEEKRAVDAAFWYAGSALVGVVVCGTLGFLTLPGGLCLGVALGPFAGLAACFAYLKQSRAALKATARRRRRKVEPQEDLSWGGEDDGHHPSQPLVGQ